MQNRLVEQESNNSSEQVNLNSIHSRFGPEITAKVPGMPQLEKVASLKNSITTNSQIPDKRDHFVSWRLTKLTDIPGGECAVSLHDLMYTRLLIENNAQRWELADRLREEIDDYSIQKGFTEKSKFIKNINSEIRQIPGLEIEIGSEEADFIPERFGHSIKIIGKSGGILELNVFDEPWFNLDIPVDANFDANLALYSRAMEAISKGLGLSYPPKLKYNFIFQKDSAIVDSTLASSTDFPDYLSKCIKNWNDLNVRQVRAIASRGKDGSVILITEDPTLGAARQTMLNRFIYSDIRKQGDAWEFDSATVAESHEIIFSSFDSVQFNRTANPQMTEKFPDGDFSGWLHLFINIDQKGTATLVKDVRGELEEKELSEMLPQIKTEYGLELGREMPDTESEAIAKSVMMGNRIEKEAAMMEVRVDKATANKFRNIARAALIYGSEHSKQIYEEFLKLLG